MSLFEFSTSNIDRAVAVQSFDLFWNLTMSSTWFWSIKKTQKTHKKHTKASHFNQTGIALHFSHRVSNLHAWQTYRGWRIISGVGKGWKGWNRGWVDVGAGITSPVRPGSTCSRGRSWAVWKRRPVIRGTAHNLNTTIRYSVSGKGFTSTCSRFYVEE